MQVFPLALPQLPSVLYTTVEVAAGDELDFVVVVLVFNVVRVDVVVDEDFVPLTVEVLLALVVLEEEHVPKEA